MKNKELKFENAERVINLLNEISEKTGFSFDFEDVDITLKENTFIIKGIKK